jgi:hypothetical protein
MAHDNDTDKHSQLKRLRVVRVVVASNVAWGGCVAVRERHITQRWTRVGLKVP